ncbi:MAG: hypothetical protein ACRDZW_09110 [Acidimicrobiales bacterium]
MTGPSQSFKRGDRVLVPWGLDDVVGVVEDIFGPPADPFVRVRVSVAGPGDEAEVPIKMSALREAPPGSIAVSAVTSAGGRLVAQVDVRGYGLDRQVQVWADHDQSELLEKELGRERARAELAGFAAHVVASMLENEEGPMDYLLSRADVRYLVARAVGDSAS